MLKAPSTKTANLIKAREMIADEKDWSRGLPERSRGDGSYQRCAANALFTVYGNAADANVQLISFEKIAFSMFGMPITKVNDNLGHAAVMQLFDKAIEISLVE